MPTLDLQLSKKDEICVTNEKQIAYLIKSGETVYIAVDPNEKNNGFLKKNKRKLICILENVETKKVSIEGYNNREFRNNFLMLATKVLVSKNKDKQRKVRAIIYVKASKQDADLKLIKEKKLLAIEERIYTLIKDCRIYRYENYPQMCQAYDAETGEFIDDVLKDLSDTYIDMKAVYNEYISKYSAERFTKILNEMEKILKEMKDGTNEANSDRVTTNTVNPWAIAFKNLAEKFNELELKLKLNLLKSKVLTLQTDCENAILSSVACREEIFGKRNEIKEKIDFLLGAIQKDSTITTVVIDDFGKSYSGLREELSALKAEINTQSIENLKSDSDKEDLRQEKMKKYFREKQPIFDDIKNHALKTSRDKAKILNKILEYLENIKEKIISDSPLDEITDIIESIKTFIKDSKEVLSPIRGLFHSEAESMKLIKNLKSQLDNLVPPNDQEQSFMSARP